MLWKKEIVDQWVEFFPNKDEDYTLSQWEQQPVILSPGYEDKRNKLFWLHYNRVLHGGS